jgi:hypothetical protein
MPVIPTNRESQSLRDRAWQLRSLANHVPTDALDDVLRRAGEDTWIGPTASRCVRELRGMRSALDTMVGDLRRAAHELDQQAARVDALAALR